MSYLTRHQQLQSQELLAESPPDQPTHDQQAQMYRNEFEWARAQLSIGACAIELARTLGLSGDATKEFALGVIRKASKQDSCEVKQLIYELSTVLNDGDRLEIESSTGTDQLGETNTMTSITSITEFRQRRAKPVQKSKRTGDAKNHRKLKEVTPFVAPSEKMSNDEIVAFFLPKSESDKSTFVLKVCADITSELESVRETDKDLEYALTDQTSRSMSFLVHVSNYLKANDKGDLRIVREISNVLGSYIISMNSYIYAIAQHLVNENSTLAIDDLIAEGQLGLMESLGRFDLGWEGMKFISYARIRIHGAMVDAMRNKGSTIKMSRGDLKRYKYYQDMINRGKTIEEIAEFLDTTPENLERSLANIHSVQTLTLDATIDRTPRNSTGETRVLSDIVPDSRPSTEDLILGPITGSLDLAKLINRLRGRDADIISMRFGMPPYDKPHKLYEIAEKHGFSESRASQLVKEGLGRLHDMIPQDVKNSKRVTTEELV